MKIIILNSKNYGDKSKNYGDCILVINKENEMLVYDCGSVEHAQKVEFYKKKYNCRNVVGLLSHNDADHFNGFEYLLEKKILNDIYTLSALRYIDDILKICKKPVDRQELKQLIIEKYDNIKTLSHHIVDIYTDNKMFKENIIGGVNVIGPKYDYALEAINRAIFDMEPNTIDGDSVMNAASVCVECIDINKKILLTGDSTYENIKDLLKGYDYVQLPHHGREQQAKEIFDFYDDCDEDPVYLVSDNTGDTNGGSDGRNFKGRNCINTKKYDDDIVVDTISYSTKIGTFGIK